MSSKLNGRAGGPATTAGIDFQSRLAAWFECAILAETECGPLWDWPQTSSFETVYSETGADVDDLRVMNSAGETAYVQAKVRLPFSAAEDSQLASVLRQFVKQHRKMQAATPNPGDRIILAVSAAASSRVREELPRILERVRRLPAGAELAEAASGASEQEALQLLKEHICREWTAITKTPPTLLEVKSLLSTIRVSIHDLSSGGASAREALQMLRASILVDPQGAETCWLALIGVATESGILQTGCDRAQLQQRITSLGIALRVVRSYRADVELLAAHSARTMARLEKYATIRASAEETVAISRASSDALTAMALEGSVVVTGAPGAGKSAALFALASVLHPDANTVVLAADSLASGSLGELRVELGLDHDVVDVMRNWPGVGGSHLLIDALDAARGENTQAMLLDLIEAVADEAPDWKMAVSIRRFELRHNARLQTIFTKPTHDAPVVGNEFARLAHFTIPALSDDELESLATLTPTVYAAWQGRSELTELLRNLFNLRLFAELVTLAAPPSDIQNVADQLGLLEMYWRHRVLDGAPGGDRRENFLRVLCKAMAAGHTLRMTRGDAQQISMADPSLDELLRAQVLSEEDGIAAGDTISFAHHVLFDFAIARLVLRVPAPRLTNLTEEDPDLLLVIRPSYEFHFRYLWQISVDRSEFWSVSITFADSASVPEIGKIIAPTLAALEATSLAQLRPLISALSAEDGGAEVALLLLRHLVSARLGVAAAGTAIPFDRRQLWSEFTLMLGEQLTASTAYLVRNLLLELTFVRQDYAEEALLGEAARLLFAFVESIHTNDRFLITTAIQAVARTVATAPSESETLLRRILEPSRLESIGYLEAPVLSDEILAILPYSPALVTDVYRAIFARSEQSDEKTPITQGILSMSSNRRQDYDMAKYHLAQHFPSFVENNPVEALEAVTSVRRTYRRSDRMDSAQSIVVPWGSEIAEIEPDSSFFWNSAAASPDEEVTILNEYEAWLSRHLTGDTSFSIGEFIARLIKRPRPTAIWRRVISAFARAGVPTASTLYPILTFPRCLTDAALGPAVSELLPIAFPSLSDTQRSDVEAAILCLAEGQPVPNPDEHDLRRGRKLRDRYLLLIDEVDIIQVATLEARANAVTDGQESKGNDGQPDVVLELDYGEREALLELGVDSDSEANKKFRELEAPVELFGSRWLNEFPTAREGRKVEGPLRALWQQIVSGDSDAIDPQQLDFGWGHVSNTASQLSGSKWLKPDTAFYGLVKDILLAAAKYEPSRPARSSEQFDESVSWSSLNPRGSAATGLVRLAHYAPTLDSRIDESILSLSNDPSAEVRFLLVRNFALLANTMAAQMWTIADQYIPAEPSLNVVKTLAYQLPAMGPTPDAASLTQRLTAIMDRGRGEASVARSLRAAVIELLTDLYVWRGIDEARPQLDRLIANLPVGASELVHIVHRIRKAITYGRLDSSDDAPRRRSLSLIESLLATCAARIDALTTEFNQSSEDQTKETLRANFASISTILHTISAEIFFGSGAYAEKQREEQLDEQVRRRLFDELGPILDLFELPGLPATVHYIVETLESFIDFDPPGVFLRVDKMVTAGEGTYELDPQAATLVASIVERYLAVYPTLLQQDPQCRTALIHMLDVFVRAGWPETRRLTYELAEIFR